jgi:uncharacterized protein
MQYSAVTREHGSAWNESLPMSEQTQFTQHSDYISTLLDKGFVVLGGPIGDGKRILLIYNTEDEKVVEKWLADDPWTPIDVLKTIRIELWEILLRKE